MLIGKLPAQECIVNPRILHAATPVEAVKDVLSIFLTIVKTSRNVFRI